MTVVGQAATARSAMGHWRGYRYGTTAIRATDAINDATPPGNRRSGPRRYIDPPNRDVPFRSPSVSSSESVPVRRAKAGAP
jgi:hypothetical protein